MNKTEKLLLLAKLQMREKEIDEVRKNLRFVFGNVVDSPIMDAMWGCFGDLTDIVAEKIGDRHKWLEWFIWENDWGKKEYEARFEGQERPIKTFEDLLWVIGQGEEK